MKISFFSVFSLIALVSSQFSHALPTEYRELQIRIKDQDGLEHIKRIIFISDTHEAKMLPEHFKYIEVLTEVLKQKKTNTFVSVEASPESERRTAEIFMLQTFNALLSQVPAMEGRLSLLAADTRLPASSGVISYFHKLNELGRMMDLMPSQDATKLAVDGINALVELAKIQRAGSSLLSVNTLLRNAAESEKRAREELTKEVEAHFQVSKKELETAWESLHKRYALALEGFNKIKLLLRPSDEEAESTDLVVLALDRLIAISKYRDLPKSAVLNVANFLAQAIFLEGHVLDLELAAKNVKALAESDQLIQIFGQAHNEAAADFYRNLFPNVANDSAYEFFYRELGAGDKSLFFGEKSLMSVLPISEKAPEPITIDHFKRLLAGERSCWECNKVSFLLTCGGCKKAQYCSKDCQIKSWKNTHKSACKNL